MLLLRKNFSFGSSEYAAAWAVVAPRARFALCRHPGAMDGCKGGK